MTTPELSMTRTFAAPPQRLWEAWTTPSGLATWWWARWPNTTYDVDLRVGGRYRIADPDAGIAVHGEYLEIEPTDRLTFSWVWVDDDGDGPLEQVAVTFTAAGSGTRVDLVHTGPWTSIEPVESYRQGWDAVFSSLAALFVDTPAS